MEGIPRVWRWGSIVVGVVLIGVVGYWMLVERWTETPVVPVQPAQSPALYPTPAARPAASPTVAPLPSPTVSPAVGIRAEGNQYVDAAYGYSLWYPKTWRPEPCGDGCRSFGPIERPEETSVEVTVVASPLAAAKARLPIFANEYNRLKNEEVVTLGSEAWTKLTIEQKESGLAFIKHLSESAGKTYVVSLGGESPTTTAIYLQMLESFSFTQYD